MSLVVEWLVVLAADPEAPSSNPIGCRILGILVYQRGLPAAGPVAYKSGVSMLSFEKSSLNKT